MIYINPTIGMPIVMSYTLLQYTVVVQYTDLVSITKLMCSNNSISHLYDIWFQKRIKISIVNDICLPQVVRKPGRPKGPSANAISLIKKRNKTTPFDQLTPPEKKKGMLIIFIKLKLQLIYYVRVQLIAVL